MSDAPTENKRHLEQLEKDREYDMLREQEIAAVNDEIEILRRNGLGLEELDNG